MRNDNCKCPADCHIEGDPDACLACARQHGIDLSRLLDNKLYRNVR